MVPNSITLISYHTTNSILSSSLCSYRFTTAMRILLSVAKQETSHQHVEERTLCVAFVLVFMFVTISILLGSLCKGCRNRNNNNAQHQNQSADVAEQHGGENGCEHRSIVSVKIPAIIYGEGESLSSFDDTTCAICLAEFERGESVRVLPCKHVFHKECIDEWIPTKSLYCPICRDQTIDREFAPTRATNCHISSAMVVLNFGAGNHNFPNHL